VALVDQIAGLPGEIEKHRLGIQKNARDTQLANQQFKLNDLNIMKAEAENRKLESVNKFYEGLDSNLSFEDRAKKARENGLVEEADKIIKRGQSVATLRGSDLDNLGKQFQAIGNEAKRILSIKDPRQRLAETQEAVARIAGPEEAQKINSSNLNTKIKGYMLAIQSDEDAFKIAYPEYKDPDKQLGTDKQLAAIIDKQIANEKAGRDKNTNLTPTEVKTVRRKERSDVLKIAIESREFLKAGVDEKISIINDIAETFDADPKELKQAIEDATKDMPVEERGMIMKLWDKVSEAMSSKKEVERMVDGRKAIFDSKTKTFIKWAE